MKQLQQALVFVQKLSRREKIIFYCTLTVVGIVLFDRLLVHPVATRIKSLDLQIKEREAGVARAFKVLERKEAIARETTQYASFMRIASSDEEGMVALLKEVEALAQTLELNIIDMKPGGIKEEKGGPKKFLVNITCDGHMEKLMEFMFSVENSSSLLTIEKYQISPKSRESSVAQCAITISKIAL